MALSQVMPGGSSPIISANEEYLPEPSTTGIGAFSDILQTAGGYAGNILSSGLNVGGFEQLLAAQMQAQMEMQQVSMLSNVEKSRHETKMTPIRNIRAG